MVSGPRGSTVPQSQHLYELISPMNDADVEDSTEFETLSSSEESVDAHESDQLEAPPVHCRCKCNAFHSEDCVQKCENESHQHSCEGPNTQIENTLNDGIAVRNDRTKPTPDIRTILSNNAKITAQSPWVDILGVSLSSNVSNHMYATQAVNPTADAPTGGPCITLQNSRQSEQRLNHFSLPSPPPRWPNSSVTKSASETNLETFSPPSAGSPGHLLRARGGSTLSTTSSNRELAGIAIDEEDIQLPVGLGESGHAYDRPAGAGAPPPPPVDMLSLRSPRPRPPSRVSSVHSQRSASLPPRVPSDETRHYMAVWVDLPATPSTPHVACQLETHRRCTPRRSPVAMSPTPSAAEPGPRTTVSVGTSPPREGAAPLVFASPSVSVVSSLSEEASALSEGGGADAAGPDTAAVLSDVLQDYRREVARLQAELRELRANYRSTLTSLWEQLPRSVAAATVAAEVPFPTTEATPGVRNSPPRGEGAEEAVARSPISTDPSEDTTATGGTHSLHSSVLTESSPHTQSGESLPAPQASANVGVSCSSEDASSYNMTLDQLMQAVQRARKRSARAKKLSLLSKDKATEL